MTGSDEVTGSDRGPSGTRVWAGLAGWLGVTFLAAAVGSLFMPGPWYDALAKPAWTPPDAVFGPVWTTLYVLMGVAAWLVWRRGGLAGAGAALAVYGLQLALNAAWSWLFFGRQAIGAALVDIVLLWLAIALTLVLFRRHDRVAGWLIVPYLLWVTYAAALNAAIWRMN